MSSHQHQMLTSTIKKIRDILRAVGVTDSDSISHCIAFITLRLTTPQMCQSLGIPEEFAFVNFRGDLNEEELRNKFWQRQANSKCFITYLRREFGLETFKFKDEIKNTQFWQIFSLLEKLDTEDLKQSCDIVGDIYEMHLKTGSKSARDLGQYFTNRKVIKYMIEMVRPKVKNGLIETIVDPTMGTGGFLTMAIDYLNKEEKVDWYKNRKRIFGFDLARQVQEYAGLNLLLETGVKFPHMLTRDTLNNDIAIAEDALPESCDIILANEPMGLKGLKYACFCERIKELKINGTKAEPAFIQLFMQALNPNGRCAVIIPDGVLFSTSKQHSETRKHLIENFDVRQIVKMNDKNFFMNTGVNASIVYFANTGQTKNVQFSTISLNSDGSAIIEIVGEMASYEQIVEKDYVLNPNLYDEEKAVEVSGMEYKTLGELCKFLPKSRRKASEGVDKGNHNFYSSSTTIKKCDMCDYKQETILIGTGGNANIHYDVQFSCSTDVLLLVQEPKESILLKYIYYYLKNNIDILDRGFRGTGLKHITKDYVTDLKIPLPSLAVQKETVDKLDILSTTNDTCTKLIEQLTDSLQVYLNGLNNFGNRHTLTDLCIFNPENVNKSIETFSYVDISSVVDNKIARYQQHTRSDAPSRAKRLVKLNDIIISTVRPELKGHTIIQTMPSLPLVVSTGFCVIRIKDLTILSPKFLFYYILSNSATTYFKNNATGSMYPSINTKIIETMNIPVPATMEQKRCVDFCDQLFDLVNNLNQQILSNRELAKNIIQSTISV